MRTLAEIHYALRLLNLDERLAIATWLEGYQEQETGPMRVEEPAAAYTVELPYMTLEEFLKFEERSTTSHEYVNGVVYAMSSPSMAHFRVVDGLVDAFKKRLKDGQCKVFYHEVELHLKTDTDEIVYLPDVMVSCDPTGWTEKWICNPRLVIEVLSPSTQYTDRREKAMTYRRMASVEEYVIAAQSSHQLTFFRRADNWVPDVASGPDAVAEFRSLKQSVPLAEIYRNAFPKPRGT